MANYMFGRKQKNWVKTGALKRYMKENGIKGVEIARQLGVPAKSITNWNSRGSVPREVLEHLGIKARNRETNAPKVVKKPKGGDLMIAYVDGDKRKPFEAFCASMGINVKNVL